MKHVLSLVFSVLLLLCCAAGCSSSGTEEVPAQAQTGPVLPEQEEAPAGMPEEASAGMPEEAPAETPADPPGGGAVYRLDGTDVTLSVPASAEISLEDHNVIRVHIPEEDAGTADLTGLEALSSMYRLDLTAEGDIGTLILPSNAASVVIEAGSVGYLDASRCHHTRPMELRCHVEEADMNESLESVVVSDDSLFRFGGLTGLGHIAFLHPVDLSPLMDMSLSGQQKSVLVMRAPEDEPWDLSPLADADITSLRLGDTVTEDELNTLSGGSFTAIEMFDERIGNLSFLDNMPQVSSLLLTVSANQPEEVLPYMNTMTACPSDVLAALSSPLPTDQLLSFSERGEIFLFSDSRR